jgi:thiamine-phosphate pyrophosphorylase
VGRVPPLWLFTDASRMPDLLSVVRRLPKGLCGVVFRHDGVADRAALAKAVGQCCRDRRLMLAAAGRPLGLAGVGAHLRGGRRAPDGGHGPSTASAHGVPDMVRARRAGVAAVFLSPVFPTGSHPGAPALGVVRWARMVRYARAARGGGPVVLALGGIDGAAARRLPRAADGAGAIAALLGDCGGCR